MVLLKQKKKQLYFVDVDFLKRSLIVMLRIADTGGKANQLQLYLKKEALFDGLKGASLILYESHALKTNSSSHQ